MSIDMDRRGFLHAAFATAALTTGLARVSLELVEPAEEIGAVLDANLIRLAKAKLDNQAVPTQYVVAVHLKTADAYGLAISETHMYDYLTLAPIPHASKEPRGFVNRLVIGKLGWANG